MNPVAALPARQPDRRMIKTKEAIRRALLCLLSQKDASHIKVSELTETAEISRKTFYLHYSCVDEALAELENEIEQQVVAELRACNFWENRYNLYSVISRVDQALKRNQDYSSYLKNRYSRFFIMYRLKDAIKYTLLEMTRDKFPAEESDLDVATDFAVSGVVSMYYEWLRAQSITLKQLAEKADRLLSCGFGGLLKKKTDKKE